MEIILAITGTTLLILSWINLLASTSRDDFTWGLCSLFLPPLSYLYGFWRMDIAKDALILAGTGWALIGLSYL